MFFGIGTIMMKDLRDTGIWKSVVVTPIHKDGAHQHSASF